MVLMSPGEWVLLGTAGAAAVGLSAALVVPAHREVSDTKNRRRLARLKFSLENLALDAQVRHESTAFQYFYPLIRDFWSADDFSLPALGAVAARLNPEKTSEARRAYRNLNDMPEPFRKAVSDFGIVILSIVFAHHPIAYLLVAKLLMVGAANSSLAKLVHLLDDVKQTQESVTRAQSAIRCHA